MVVGQFWGVAGKENMSPRFLLLLAKVFPYLERTLVCDSAVLWSGCCVLVVPGTLVQQGSHRAKGDEANILGLLY